MLLHLQQLILAHLQPEANVRVLAMLHSVPIMLLDNFLQTIPFYAPTFSLLFPPLYASHNSNGEPETS